MLTLELGSEQVRVETIVEAREAAIIFLAEEAERGADPTTLAEIQFRLFNRERLLGLVVGGYFYQAH